MSEPKRGTMRTNLCPMSFNLTPGPKDSYECIREKCGWWVEEKRWTTVEEQRMWGVKEISIGGHCVALDWGKK